MGTQIMTDTKEDAVKLFPEMKDADRKSPEMTKFIPENENKNGLSPISIDSVKVTFTGLTKEELMKYANDPFWVRIRWFLFVFFWIIWLAMLGGAIYIVVVTPKCKEDTPPTWWERSPFYVVDCGQMYDSNKGVSNLVINQILQAKIDHLASLGVESCVLKNFMVTSESKFDNVNNFTYVNAYLEGLAEFRKDVLEHAQKKGVNIILSFEPNHSGKGQYFIRSALRQKFPPPLPVYDDWYVWYPENYTTKPDNPPNNWLSVYNGTAWEWHDTRKQFYLHQFSVEQPDFNFWNPTVIEFFEDVFQFWIDQGFINFHLDKAEFLVEDRNFTNETRGRDPGYNMYDYGFYTHYRTCDLPETQAILQRWSEFIRNNNSGFFGVSGGVREKIDIADLITKPVMLRAGFNATELNNVIATRRASIKGRHAWEWICPPSYNISICHPSLVQDGLTIVAFLLPGVPVMRLGYEIQAEGDAYNENNWRKHVEEEENIPESRLNIIKNLMKLRPLPAFVYGDYNSRVLNSSVFSFTRTKSGSPGYLIAWNLADEETLVDFTVMSAIPQDLVLVLKTGNARNATTYHLRSRVNSANVQMPSQVTLVFSFVPK